MEAMKKLAKVHGVVLRDKQFVARHEETHTYWQEVVRVGISVSQSWIFKMEFLCIYNITQLLMCLE